MEDDGHDNGHHGSVADAKVGEVLARAGGGRAVGEFGPPAVLREATGDGVGEAGEEARRRRRRGKQQRCPFQPDRKEEEVAGEESPVFYP